MNFRPSQRPWQDAYRLLVGSVVPRPIAWVSTIGPDGECNLAPFSFFMAVCADPMTLAFAPNVRSDPSLSKDTLHNLEANGECVINIVTENLAEAMNLTSTDFPYEIDEFKAAGLTAVPSLEVRPPRVGESPVNFECRVAQIVPISRNAGGGTLAIVTVVVAHVADELLENGRVIISRLRPVARLAGNDYARVNDFFTLVRPTYAGGAPG